MVRVGSRHGPLGVPLALIVLTAVAIHSAALLGSPRIEHQERPPCWGYGCDQPEGEDCGNGCFCWNTNQWCESDGLCEGSYCTESEGQCGPCHCTKSLQMCTEQLEGEGD
jgi:hypothetical protein